MKKVFTLLQIALLLIIFPVITFAQSNPTAAEQAEGKIKNIRYEVRNIEDQSVRIIHVEVEGTKGSISGKTVNFEQTLAPTVDEKLYQQGDEVYISVSSLADGTKVYGITDFIRTKNQIILFIIFLIILAVIGGMKGIRSIMGLFISLFIIIIFIIPNILNGADALFITVIGSAVILIPTVYFVHGFNKKSSVAIIGSILSLIIAAGLSILFTQTGKITGIGNDDALYLIVGGNTQIKAQALFLSGVIIGTLGVLIDMTIGQSSAIQEINEANPTLTFKELYVSTMNVGKDHIGSLVNTLFLAYAGASLPILIFFTQTKEPILFNLSLETTAMEILRAFIGSIALITSVPITTLIGVYLVKKNNDKRN